jgi:hypothetical protein
MHAAAVCWLPEHLRMTAEHRKRQCMQDSCLLICRSTCNNIMHQQLSPHAHS